MIDRREFVRQLSAGVGAALSPGVLAAIASGVSRSAEAGQFLSPRELEIVASLAEAIIPRTDTPGARDVGVAPFIDMILSDFTPGEEVAVLRGQLAWISDWLNARGVATLEQADAGERHGLLQALDGQAFGAGPDGDVPGGDPALFAVLKPLTLAGYYTSEAGARQELQQPPFGPYEGDIPLERVGKAWS